MRILNNHILAFGRFFLLLFFLGNSGFTAVLYHCTMSTCTTTEEMSGTGCCAGMACCTCVSGGETAGLQSSVEHGVTVAQRCLTATLAGGNLTEPTIVEKAFNGQQSFKVDLLAATLYETVIDSGLDLSVSHLASAASKVSKSSVEKYVLNATFLI